MGIVFWILFGLLTGIIASAITGSSKGLLGDIVIGIVGAILGGLVLSLFGQPGVTGFNLYSVIVAVIGAVLLVWISRSIRGSSI